MHLHALTAAHLAEAAALQGHFWPVHELLFHHQKALEDPDLLNWSCWVPERSLRSPTPLPAHGFCS